MAYEKQLKDARESGALRAIAGTCSSSQQFTDRINEAQERLAKRGEFTGMVQNMRLCFRGCYPTWPRSVGTILAVRGSSIQSQISVQNSFSNFPAMDSANGFGGWFQYLGAWSGQYSGYGGYQIGGGYGGVLSDAGTAPTYNDISGVSGKLIRYYVVKANDIGKTITLYGKQYGAQPLQEKDSTGAWIDGLTLTSARPFVSTTVAVTHIQSIIRQPTEGMAYLYEYDPATDLLRDLAVFEPNETHPRYRRSLLQTGCGLGGNQLDANGLPCTRSIEALVKLNFIPVKNERDFLLVDDFYALKFMVQAIKSEEANDQDEAEKLILKSVRELNFTDRDKNPDNQIPVRVDFTMAPPLTNAW